MNWYYFTAFWVVFGWTCAFGLGWFMRKAIGPREDESPTPREGWFRHSVTRPIEFGRNSIDASESQRRAAVDVEDAIAQAEARGRLGCP